MQLAGFLFPQYFDNNGNPLSGGKIYAYAADTVTPQDTYSNAAGTALNTNPITLSSSGRTKIFLQNLSYDFVIKNSVGVTIDTISGVGSSGSGGLSSVDTIAALRALASGAFNYVEVGGYSTVGDGGGGLFYWSASSTATQDYGVVIQPSTNPITGRWIRLYSGAVNVRWFGAKGDGATNDITAINTAKAYVQALPNGGTLFFPHSTGGYLFSVDPVFDNKTHVEMEDGAYFTSASIAITFGGGFRKGPGLAFSATVGAVSFAVGSIPYALPQWWGATGLNVFDDSAYIQKALNYFSVVKLLKGTYRQESALTLNSNNRLIGEGKYVSTLKVPVGVTVTRMISANAVSYVEISDIGLDNYLNYPDDQTVAANQGVYLNDTFPKPINSGFIAENGSHDITIKNCYFYGITGTSIRCFQSANPFYNIWIQNNSFLYGSYVLGVIKIQGGTADPSRSYNIHVNGNTLNYNSSQKYALVGIATQNASNDAIELYRCKDGEVANNIVNYAASSAIRIERSQNLKVYGNTITEPGNSGVNVYNSSTNIIVSGNTIVNWGRTPAFDNLRSSGGVNYLAREAAVSGTVNLPANPAAPAVGECPFVVNPYSLDGLNVTRLPAYNNGNYYSATPFTSLPDGGSITNAANFAIPSDQGILPFRGFAAISVNQFSSKVIVCDNNIVGTLSLGSDGKYTHACDFGIASVHPSNMPQTYPMPFYESGNVISGYIYDSVYTPYWCDPTNLQGAITYTKKSAGNYTTDSTNLQPEVVPYGLDSQALANSLQSETAPALVLDGSTGYVKIRGVSRPLLDVGTDAFGLLMIGKITSVLNSTNRFLFDAGAGGAATAGFQLAIRSNRVQFTISNGASTLAINTAGITDWGDTNQDFIVYATRDSAGRMHLMVNELSEVVGAAGAAITYNVNTTNGIGIGTDANNTGNNVPMHLYRCVLWKGQSFTKTQLFDRINKKRIIRTGDSVILDLDMKSYGYFLKDNTDISKVIYASPTGFSSTAPNKECFASWTSAISGNNYVTEGEGVSAGGKSVPDDFFITHVAIETAGTPTVRIGSSSGGSEILPSLVLTAGKTLVPINKATANGTICVNSNTTDAIKWCFYGFRAATFTLQASILRRGSPVVLNTNTTAVGNVLTGEDDLMSFSVPAALLAVDGDSIRMTAAGRFAATANNKTLKAYFGSDVLFTTGALAITTASDWTLDVEIIRSGAATQKCRVLFRCSDTTVTIACDYVAGTQTLSADNTLKLTGTGTATDDIIQELMKTRFEPA